MVRKAMAEILALCILIAGMLPFTAQVQASAEQTGIVETDEMVSTREAEEQTKAENGRNDAWGGQSTYRFGSGKGQ